MDTRLILKATGFLSLEGIGIPGNLVILACFAHFRIFNGTFMPVDIILFKLSFINLVVVLIRGIPQALATLGIERLFDQKGCNFVIFTYRVCRAMSICMTSLLSCYQCVLLAPSSCFWTTIKHTLLQKLLPVMIFCWCLNITNYLLPMFSITWPLFPNSTAHVLNLEFCLIIFPSYSVFLLSGTMSIVRDVICIGLMSVSSLYIVMILYRHRRQVKSIRSSEQAQRSTAETKAANAVLMLVSTYVVFFGLDNGIWLYSISSSINVSPELTDARVFFQFLLFCPESSSNHSNKQKVQLKLRSVGPKKFARELRKSHVIR